MTMTSSQKRGAIRDAMKELSAFIYEENGKRMRKWGDRYGCPDLYPFDAVHALEAIVDEETAFPLKIGRHTYQITDKDVFRQTGSNYVLLTQGRDKLVGGYLVMPRLSRVAMKSIDRYKRKPHGRVAGEFSLVLD